MVLIIPLLFVETFFGKTSVAVVINSMSTRSDGMDIIKKRVESLIEQPSSEDIAYFILVIFNGQTVGSAFVFASSAELKLKLNELRATSGGYCKGTFLVNRLNIHSSDFLCFAQIK
jgi:hypothetical protein